MTATRPVADPGVYLTIRDICDTLKVERNYVTRLLNDGLPHLRIGNRVRVRTTDLEAFMAARTLRAGGGHDEGLRDRVATQAPVGRAMDRKAAGRQGRLPVRNVGRPRDGGAKAARDAEATGPDDIVFRPPRGRTAA